jgi:hypothetical protein
VAEYEAHRSGGRLSLTLSNPERIAFLVKSSVDPATDPSELCKQGTIDGFECIAEDPIDHQYDTRIFFDVANLDDPNAVAYATVDETGAPVRTSPGDSTLLGLNDHPTIMVGPTILQLSGDAGDYRMSLIAYKEKGFKEGYVDLAPVYGRADLEKQHSNISCTVTRR